MTAQCSKGWGERCAEARGKRCACACGGVNHGGLYRREAGDTMELTDGKVFQNPKGLFGGPDTRFLDDAPSGDIVATRDPSDAFATRIEGVLRRWAVHSPTGLEWGYGGSGPADLALNILGMHVHPWEAYRLHNRFLHDLIARQDRDGFTLTHAEVRAWIDNAWVKEGARGA